MKNILFPAIVTCIMVSPVTCLADITVEPVGIKMVWKSLKKEFDGMQTYNSKKGTYISLALDGGDKNIISFDKDKSEISLSDGTTELGGEFGHWNKTSKDGKMMRVETSANKLPAAETTMLTLTGKLEIVVATMTETKTIDPRELKKGDKLSMTDDFKFEVDSIGKPKWGDDPLSISLKWKRKIPELASVRFYDQAGKQIEASERGSSWSGFLGKYSITKTYNLKKKSNTIKIEMDLWTDAEQITVPIDMSIDLSGSQ